MVSDMKLTILIYIYYVFVHLMNVQLIARQIALKSLRHENVFLLGIPKQEIVLSTKVTS